MTSGGDLVPVKDADFNNWQKPLYDYAKENLTRWVSNAEFVTWTNLINTWETAYAETATGDAKHSQVLAKNEARKALEAKLRQLIKYVFNAHPEIVTHEVRAQLGLPVYKTTRTPSPVAVTYPDHDTDSGMIRRLTIHFYDRGKKKSKAKPDGQHGAEMLWEILPAPPKSINELVHSAFDTHTPFTLEFSDEDRGKTIYFCLRWENTRGEKGPWSEIYSAIIP
ncbi:MAG: hypothetical protein LBF88_03820 [Planctomycetaceae bacterium]|jgi:hypothetical protein|nr:hypothetical protein [Planctomycetaceae bacterium]